MSFSARAIAFAKLWLFSLFVGVGLLAAGHASADGLPFSRIVVFGDSLSDPGNAYQLRVISNVLPFTVEPPTYGMEGLDPAGIPEVVTLIPEAPYAGRRFSNGPTWIELLGTAIGLGSNVKPAVPSALAGPDGGVASNYAVGGATAASIGVSQFPLGTQVQLFLSDVRGSAPSDALYVIAIGGNDIRAALVAEDPSVVIEGAMVSIAQNVEALYLAGARRFLIWNAPDLGSTPALRRLDNAVCPVAGCVASGASAASAAYNAALAQLLLGLAQLPGATIVPFDTAGSLSAVHAHPHRYGLLDAEHACIRPDVPQFGFPSKRPFRCAQPDRFFFWDGIHPTRAGHAIIAFLVGKALVEALQEH